MLSRFNNEVLSYGPSAVLPQNLNAKWIRILQKMADDFLDTNFDLNECKDPRDIGDPVLMACVYEIERYQTGGKSGDLCPRDYDGISQSGIKYQVGSARPGQCSFDGQNCCLQRCQSRFREYFKAGMHHSKLRKRVV